MKHLNGSFALSFFLLANGAWAVGTVAVSGSAGSVAGIDTTNSGGSWSGLLASAQTAKINYQHQIGAGTPLTGSNEFKCVDNQGNFAPHLFAGDHALGTDGRVDVVGGSTFSSAPPGVPTYYQASWTSTVQKNAVPNPYVLSGTYDPWDVHYSDVASLGTPDGGTADLYYQTSLLGGFQSPSGFDLGPDSLGSYQFNVSATTPAGTLNFFSIGVQSDGTVNIGFQHYAGFDVYLLGAGAHNDALTPDQRVRAEDATLLASSEGLGSFLLNDLNPNGSLKHNLDFGIVYRGFKLDPSSDPNQVLFSWHTDTVSQIAPVPEPATLAVLGMGALALLRRRK